MPSLRQQAGRARRAADQAERERLDANQRARDLAAQAFELERQLESEQLRRLESDLGPPRSAPINTAASTAAELEAARAVGHPV